MDSSLPRRIPQHTISDIAPPEQPPAPVHPFSVRGGDTLAVTRLRPAHISSDPEPAA
jgi:hypothetical protein